MHLVDEGKLNLDAPVMQYIDPWLAAQKPPQPSLNEIWHGNPLINVVTARQLLGMRSGIPDYDDRVRKTRRSST